MKLKLLFNGFRHGHINGLYKKALASEQVEIVGCIEPNGAARETAAQKLGAVFSDMSYDEWLATDIDAVAIGNAYGERGAMIIKALKAGKHVIADKPICTDLSELEEIEHLAKEKSLKVACMLDLRYQPHTLKACEILDSGELGEVRNITFNGQHFIDYGSRPEWYFEEGMHGGTLNDLAIHGVDLVRMLTHKEFDKIDAARVWNAYAYKNPDFKDCALFMARLEGNVGVMADVSYSAPRQAFSLPSYWEFRIWCDKGMVCFNRPDAAVTVYKDGEETPIRYTELPACSDYLTDFVEEIRSGGEDMTENIIASTRFALMLQQEAEKENAI